MLGLFYVWIYGWVKFVFGFICVWNIYLCLGLFVFGSVMIGFCFMIGLCFMVRLCLCLGFICVLFLFYGWALCIV